MFLEEDHMTQPSGVWKSLVRTVPKSFLQGKSLSVNRSSTVDSAIPMPDITSTIATMIPHGILMMDIHQMLLILTKASWSNKRVQSGYYSRSVPATELNSIRIINSISIQQTGYYFYSDQIRKSKGTNHCSINSKSFTVHQHNHSETLLLSVETAFTPVKAIYSP